MVENLKRSPLFSRLTDAQFGRVAERATVVTLAEGQSLFETGDEAKRFYFVQSGQIKLYRLSPSGDEKIIEIVTPGHTFAEALMFQERPSYPVGAVALQAASLISIDAIDFVRMLRDSIDTCFMLMADMSIRLRHLIMEIDELSLQSASCRVASYLLNNQPANVTEFNLEVPKQVLASRLSVKPETFSRIIKRLKDDGILDVEGSRVRIIDRGALLAIADSCTL